MHHLDLLSILAIGFAAALVLGLLTHRLKLSPIVGYLLAGFVVGPHSPGFVADAAMAAQLAEVGVILLMFGVGLHFDLHDLLAVKRIAVPGAVGQSLGATALGVVVALAFGLSTGTGLMLGLGLAVASTVVLMRVLEDNQVLDTPAGHAAVGWLIVEDIFTVLVLVLLPALAATLAPAAAAEPTAGGPGLAMALVWALAKLAVLCVLILPVGGRVVPWLMAHVARSRSRELFTLAVLVVAIVIAVGAAVGFGASVALGAFLAGMVVGKTRVSHQAAADILPLRDAFAVLFFISVGMLFDPKFLLTHPGLVLACLGIILVAKPLIAGVIVVALGYSSRTALTVALGLAQIGEFSFILAQQAEKLRIMPTEGYSVLVACALISISLNPLLFRALGPLEQWLMKRPALWGLLNRRVEAQGRALNQRTAQMQPADGAAVAIVVGYGPVGQRVTALLREQGYRTVVIDLNVDTVNGLVGAGQAAVFGEASRREILEHAGIQHAEYLLITLPDVADALKIIATARELNAGVKLLVRARYLAAEPEFAGLNDLVLAFEEEEVARAMAQRLRETVQIDRA
jgi:CPA2 family monovalent cation:H+ antiporter-2